MSNGPRSFPRRDLLRLGAAAGATLAAPRAFGAGERVLLGLIGCGRIVQTAHFPDALAQLPQAQVAAVCDVDAGRMAEMAALVEARTGRRPREIKDYRKLLEMKEIDAVSVATPDHWHALNLIHACQAGKDVYVEKPIAHNVVEGRAMVKAAQKHGRVVQVGTQQRSARHYQEAIAFVREGGLGPVVEVQTWNHYNRDSRGPAPDGEPPAGVDYDLWLGPAPRRPFNPRRFHGSWRYFRDYGGGYVTDWNTHHQDIVHQALGVSAPRSVVMGGFVALDDGRDLPDTAKVVFEYEAPQGRFTSTYSIRVGNARATDFTHARSDHGIAFFGRNGTLVVDRSGYEILPEQKDQPSRKVAGTTPMRAHFEDFLACVKSRARPRSDIESMHHATVCNQVANIAWTVGRKIYWDARTERCFSDAQLKRPDAEANRLLFRVPRAPWKIPV